MFLPGLEINEYNLLCRWGEEGSPEKDRGSVKVPQLRQNLEHSEKNVTTLNHDGSWAAPPEPDGMCLKVSTEEVFQDVGCFTKSHQSVPSESHRELPSGWQESLSQLHPHRWHQGGWELARERSGPEGSKGREVGDPSWLPGYHTSETGYLSNGVHGQVPGTL